MVIADAQCEVRTAYLGGFVGQLVSALIWFASAAIATFVNPPTGFWALAIGGAAIFPLTQALLRMAGRKTTLARNFSIISGKSDGQLVESGHDMEVAKDTRSRRHTSVATTAGDHSQPA
jgi:hypothetical protein